MQIQFSPIPKSYLQSTNPQVLPSLYFCSFTFHVLTAYIALARKRVYSEGEIQYILSAIRFIGPLWTAGILRIAYGIFSAGPDGFGYGDRENDGGFGDDVGLDEIEDSSKEDNDYKDRADADGDDDVGGTSFGVSQRRSSAESAESEEWNTGMVASSAATSKSSLPGGSSNTGSNDGHTCANDINITCVKNGQGQGNNYATSKGRKLYLFTIGWALFQFLATDGFELLQDFVLVNDSGNDNDNISDSMTIAFLELAFVVIVFGWLMPKWSGALLEAMQQNSGSSSSNSNNSLNNTSGKNHSLRKTKSKTPNGRNHHENSDPHHSGNNIQSPGLLLTFLFDIMNLILLRAVLFRFQTELLVLGIIFRDVLCDIWHYGYRHTEDFMFYSLHLANPTMSRVKVAYDWRMMRYFDVVLSNDE